MVDATAGMLVQFIGRHNTRHSLVLFVTFKTRKAVRVKTSVVSWSRVQTAGPVMIVVPDVTSTCMDWKRSREPVVGRPPPEKWRGITSIARSAEP